MITIRHEIDTLREFGTYLLETTWAGAKQRVLDMEENELEQLYLFLDSIDEILTEQQLNDFIWFDWDEIYKEIKKNG